MDGELDRNMTAKKAHMMLATMLAATMVTGCSVFISTPQVARYHVQGLDDQFNEFVVPLDAPCEGNMDIRITNNYTVQFDFEWLWNDSTDINGYTVSDETTDSPSLAPWMICKYKF